MDNQKNTISVIVPTFNSGKFLRESIGSIIAQRGNFELSEIIIVDDHSTEKDELRFLNEVASLHGVRVIQNTRSKGPAGARNSGAMVASSKWLAFLDADDVYLPNSLSCRIDAAQMFPSAGVISADFQLQDLHSGEIEEPFFQSRKKPAELFGPAYDTGTPRLLKRPYQYALNTAFCHSCSVLINRDLYWSVQGYEESLRYMEDHHLWYKLAIASDIVAVPQSAFLYRIHDSNMTHRVASPFEYRKRMLNVIRAKGHTPDLTEAISRTFANGHWQDFWWHLRRGELWKAGVNAGMCLAHRVRLL